MQLNGELRQEFEDAARADNGRAVGYGQKTKGLQHRTPDSLATDQRIKFDNEDRLLAESIVKSCEYDNDHPVTSEDIERSVGLKNMEVE
jgi:hypothetical protein